MKVQCKKYKGYDITGDEKHVVTLFSKNEMMIVIDMDDLCYKYNPKSLYMMEKALDKINIELIEEVTASNFSTNSVSFNKNVRLFKSGQDISQVRFIVDYDKISPNGLSTLKKCIRPIEYLRKIPLIAFNMTYKEIM